MNKQLLKAIKQLQKKLNKGDQITIWSDEFQIALEGLTSTNYSDEDENDPNQIQIKFDMAGL
jgi:hypothetical protein